MFCIDVRSERLRRALEQQAGQWNQLLGVHALEMRGAQVTAADTEPRFRVDVTVPQFALNEGRMIGVESLMRWRSRHAGEISPGQFIPLAEETGLIVPMGEWALYESCRMARALSDAGRPLRIAVNVSAVQIHKDDFGSTLAAVLRDTGAMPSCIELELTESTLMTDAARFIELIASVRALGISVAIDDFGTGYSSLAYLKRFQVSKLKVDRSFVQDITDDEEDRAIADAIGRRGFILFGLSLFLLASLLCAAAPNIHLLFIGRMLQGLSADAIA